MPMQLVPLLCRSEGKSWQRNRAEGSRLERKREQKSPALLCFAPHGGSGSGLILENMKSVHRLRILTLIEGVSFLVLLFVAMPLKYFAGQPLAVKMVGWLHGVLFMLVMLSLAQVMFTVRWEGACSCLSARWCHSGHS